MAEQAGRQKEPPDQCGPVAGTDYQHLKRPSHNVDRLFDHHQGLYGGLGVQFQLLFLVHQLNDHRLW